MKKLKTLPKEIYVAITGYSDPFLDARPESESFDHGVKVGVYVLKEIKTQQITRKLV